MFDLIMFDLDGTLVDTAGEISDTANDVLRELGLPEVDESIARSWIGHGSRELMIQAYANALGKNVAEIRAGTKIDSLMPLFSRFHEQRCGKRSRVYPLVRETLDELTGLAIPLAIVTNREGRFAHQVIKTHGLQDYFDPVICGDTLAARKPEALPVQYCLAQHQVSAARALLVGDSSVDIATGRNAGVACWVVPYGYNGGVPIAEAGPDRLIADFSVIAAAIRSFPLSRVRERVARSAGCVESPLEGE